MLNEHVIPYQERIKNWCQERSHVDENLLVKNLRRYLIDIDVWSVLEVIENTCPHCWNGTDECFCMFE